MKISQTLLFLLGLITTIHALALPASLESFAESSKELFKRKGGGGGGGRGGGGGGSRSSSSGSKSGSSNSGSKSSPGSSPSSNLGGSSSRGSGQSRAYGAGGGYYGGGAAVPYKPGQSSRGINPSLLLVGAPLLLFPALAVGAYHYGYPGTYHYYNRTSNTNETHPMDCYCSRFNPCGCEANNNTEYLNSIANNQSVAKLVNNTVYVDGTLQNGTTAPGGEGAASSLQQGLYEMSGLWVVVAGVSYTMWFM